jgi:A1 cistron-splicing factor AAR2
MTVRVLERAGCHAGSLIFPGDVDAPKQSAAVVPHFQGVARVAQFVDILEIDKTLIGSFPEPADRTSYCLDKSILLEKLILEHYNGWEDMLGEMQLSFLLFLLLFSYPALEHWKYLVPYLLTFFLFFLVHIVLIIPTGTYNLALGGISLKEFSFLMCIFPDFL